MKKIFIELGSSWMPILANLCLPDSKEYLIEHYGKNIPHDLFSLDFEWEGYVVEPIPEMFQKSLEEQKKWIPDAGIVNILGAIAPHTGFRQLTTYCPHDLDKDVEYMASLKYASGIYFSENNKEFDNFWVPAFTLDELLNWIGINPTILRMDIEYLEREVFETFSWGWRPNFIQVDHHNQNVDWFVKLFESKGYQIEGTALGEDSMEIWATYL